MSFNLKNRFPVFKQKEKFIYFDSACTTLIPQTVLDSINEYYNKYSGCHGRGGHFFGEETSRRYQNAREKIRQMINARFSEEIVFTKNTTEGINLIANTFPFKGNDSVLISDIEHNSNLLPWQEKTFQNKINLKVFKTSDTTEFDIEKFKESFEDNVKLVSILHHSNLTGISFPIEEISKIVHNKGAFLLVDAAQSLSSSELDVQKMHIDFLASSMHKNFGPSGVGFIYIRKELHNKLMNFIVGGETVVSTSYDQPEYADMPNRFEAGLQNYSGIIACSESVDFIDEIGISNIQKHKIELNKKMSEALKTIKGLSLLGPEAPEKRSGIYNFIIDGVDSFEAAKILSDSKRIMVRAGYHCVHAWFREKSIPPSIRVSLNIYNDEEEVEIFAKAVNDMAKYFR